MIGNKKANKFVLTGFNYQNDILRKKTKTRKLVLLYHPG